MWVGVFAVFAVVSVSTRRSPRTNSHSPARLCPLHRWTHLHRGFHHRPVDEETKLELPLREAPCSLSIGLDLEHELLALLSSEHSREASLSCLTTSLAANSDSPRPYCNGTFQCRSNNERANSRDRSSDGSGRGSRSSGCVVVVVVSLLALSRLLRGAKKHRPAVDFRVLATSHVPARIPIAGPVCAMGRVAQPAYGRRISTSVIRDSRLAAVVWRQGKKVRVFLPSDCAPSLFLIPLAVPSFPRQPGPVGRSPGSIRGLGIFVEFALLLGAYTTRNKEIY